MNQRTLNRRPKPSSLSEPWVVIDVTAILAPMLLPAMGAAEERAKGTRCLGGLRWRSAKQPSKAI